MKILGIITSILLIIGGLNWGLIGLANINVVDMLLGGTGTDRVIYVLVGVSALFQCFCFKQICSTCR